MALQDPATGKLVMTDASGQRIDLDLMDYRRALARETICPGVIVLDTSRIATGHIEASMIRKLGAPSRISEAARFRSRAGSARYFRDLMLQHPNTMHYYALSPCQQSEGWFKVVDWDSTPVGSLRVYFIAESASGSFRVQLLHITLPPIDTSEVRYVPGTTIRLERMVHPRIVWDVSANTVRVAPR